MVTFWQINKLLYSNGSFCFKELLVFQAMFLLGSFPGWSGTVVVLLGISAPKKKNPQQIARARHGSRLRQRRRWRKHEFVVEKSENLLHQKRVYPPREIIPPLPELKDFKDVPKKTSRRQGIFEDEEFPATNASIGGVTGDNANPNVAQYLEVGTVPNFFFLLKEIDVEDTPSISPITCSGHKECISIIYYIIIEYIHTNKFLHNYIYIYISYDT